MNNPPIIFTGLLEFNEDFKNLLEDIVNTSKVEGKFDFYFSSEGGNISTSKILVKELNKYSDKIKLIAMDYVQSSAYTVFHRFCGEKQIMTGTLFMIHKTSYETNITPSNIVVKDNEVNLQNLNSIEKEHEDLLNILNSHEKIVYSHGADIFITAERVSKFFNCKIV